MAFFRSLLGARLHNQNRIVVKQSIGVVEEAN